MHERFDLPPLPLHQGAQLPQRQLPRHHDALDPLLPPEPRRLGVGHAHLRAQVQAQLRRHPPGQAHHPRVADDDTVRPHLHQTKQRLLDPLHVTIEGQHVDRDVDSPPPLPAVLQGPPQLLEPEVPRPRPHRVLLQPQIHRVRPEVHRHLELLGRPRRSHQLRNAPARHLVSQCVRGRHSAAPDRLAGYSPRSVAWLRASSSSRSIMASTERAAWVPCPKARGETVSASASRSPTTSR